MERALATCLRFDDLSVEEIRVLGCLVEHEMTTPARSHPDLDDLRAACNRSAGRDPVVDLSLDDVEQALWALCERGLVRVDPGASHRVARYRHVLPEMLRLDEAETALLCVLMLRGPQSAADLKGRSESQHRFDTIDEVAAVLSGLESRAEPLVCRTDSRTAAQARWTHRLQDGDGESHPRVLAVEEHTLGVLDPYGEATAEFYDLLATAHWAEFGELLRTLLAGVDPADGPVVDLGAGTGTGLVPLLTAVAGAQIHAVEPSKAMRTALHARLALVPGLRQAVTVDPRPLTDAAMPAQACALVASAVLGHLSDAERKVLWRYVADRLPPGAPAVIEMLPPERPIVVPAERYRSVQVGRYTYEGWQQGEPDDAEHMFWTLTYRVLDGGQRVVEHRVHSRWRCLGPDDVRDEIEPFGLDLTEHPGCVVLRRS